MRIEVQLFAGARDLAGAGSTLIELADTATIQELKQALARSHPELTQLVRHSRIAVNSAYAADQDTITAEDEVALIPPVSGG